MPYEHWHTDISYVKIEHRFYFFICVLAGCRGYIVHWDFRENMKEIALLRKKVLLPQPCYVPKKVKSGSTCFFFQSTSKEFHLSFKQEIMVETELTKHA